jgi:hypothetical protein
MQLTRFDRWLRESFVNETHIRTLRAPDSIPKGVESVELPEKPGARFKHLFIIRNPKTADAFIKNLKDQSFMFSTTIEDRKAWHVPIIAPKNRSFTWRIVWLALAISASGLIVHMYRSISHDSELLKILSDSLKTFL